MDAHPLDRPIWNALTTRQRDLAEGNGLARRYPPAIAPFGAVHDTSDASYSALLALLSEGGSVGLFTTAEITPPPPFSVVRRGAVDQMVLAGPVPASVGRRLLQLGAADVPDMLALAEATRPGPFGPRTIEMGRYLGVRDEGRLVAMTGERMWLDGFAEISAVCVDPIQRGRGLAAELIAAVAVGIAARAAIPFLHVFADNAAAIALYRKLGFVCRRRMHLAVLARAAD